MNQAIELADKISLKIDRPLREFSEISQRELISICEVFLLKTYRQGGIDAAAILNDKMEKNYRLSFSEAMTTLQTHFTSPNLTLPG